MLKAEFALVFSCLSFSVSRSLSLCLCLSAERDYFR